MKRLVPPFTWQQGEHVAIIGSNGTGKTYLMTRLLDEGPRSFPILVRTKHDDTPMPRRFRRITEAKGLDDPTHDRFLFDATRMSRPEQSRRVAELFAKVWDDGKGQGWTLALDELFYCYDRLGLQEEIEMFLTQGRGMKLTMVIGMQRPVRISRFALSESMHVLSFEIEGRDHKTLADSTAAILADASLDLPRYHFAWWGRKQRAVWRGKVQDLEETV